jgi:molybdopterin converting factor small subunit
VELPGEAPPAYLFARDDGALKVHIPSPLRSYTGGLRVIDAPGRDVSELLAHIERMYPGFRFRIINEQDGIRQHIRIFVNENEVRDLKSQLTSADAVHIMCALSGGNQSIPDESIQRIEVLQSLRHLT